ncbi:MAG: hypothetical protein HN341_19500 [Verrucomicrobia bacterium]|nr:hypothetical protein [Verrucomicrobiota bacterium]
MTLTKQTNDIRVARSAAPVRTTNLMNSGWRFHKGNLDAAEAAACDDSGWVSVDLPHTASMPYWNDMTEVWEGDSCYRKTFAAPGDWQDLCVYADFEGAFQHAWIYLNGALLGENKGGYTGFQIDMTPALRFSEENVLTVRVQNGWDAQIAPRAGDTVFMNGLNRNVRFITTQAQHVDWFGQAITTPEVSHEQASLRVATEIKNRDSKSVSCEVVVEVMDSDGNTVASTKDGATLVPNGGTTVTQDLPTINTPKLWSPETPHLYDVRTHIYRGKQLVDTYTERVGIRWFEFSREQGFFLNGEPYYLWGYNVHEDRAGWGFSGTDAGMYRDMKLMKEAGANVIRACHNPHPRAFYHACNEIGLMVWDELHFWGRGGFEGGEDGSYMAEAYPIEESDRPDFDKNLKDNLRTMIREHRNHPSIIIWSLGNETVMQMQEPLLSEARRMFKDLKDLARTLDPSRPTGIGNVLPLEGLTDVNGFNGSNPKETPTGDIPIVTTEYHFGHEPARLPWRSGVIAWSGIAYGTHCKNKQTGESFGRKFGLYDYHRLLKREHASYHPDGFTPPPHGTPAALSLTADKLEVRTDGSDDTQLIVTVLDAEGNWIDETVPITLTVVSGPGLLPTGRKWDTDTSHIGRQAIEMRLREPGTAVIEVTSPGLAPARIEIAGL